MNRRHFLRDVGIGTALVALGAFLWGSLRFLRPPLTTKQVTDVVIGRPEQYALPSMTFIRPARAWLGRDEKGFYALSAVCTHLGCTVEKDAVGFHCPCHGSQFSAAGKNLRGPATKPLAPLAVTLNAQSELVIHLQKIVSPGTRLNVG